MSTDAIDVMEAVPDEAEQLDQLQRDETLIDRGVDDVLDEGYTTPEHWSVAQGFGSTASEMRRGETLAQRISQEEREPERLEGSWNPLGERRQVGSRRAGRLVDAHHGYDAPVRGSEEAIAEEVGLAGGAACAEEAAMHIIDEDGDDYDLD